MVLRERRARLLPPSTEGTVPEVVCIVLGPSVPAARIPRVSWQPGEHLCVALRAYPTGEAGPALLFVCVSCVCPHLLPPHNPGMIPKPNTRLCQNISHPFYR